MTEPSPTNRNCVREGSAAATTAAWSSTYPSSLSSESRNSLHCPAVAGELSDTSNQPCQAPVDFFAWSNFKLGELVIAVVKPSSFKTSAGASFHSERSRTTKSPVSHASAMLEKETAAFAESGGNLETPWTPGRQEWRVMIILALASLPVALDSTILVTVLPHLATSLGGTATQTFWAGTAYLLASSVVQPFIAALSDVFGRRALLVPSIMGFLIGSLVCAVSHDFSTLLTGRAIQGVGGGGIITLSQVIYGDIVPLRQRPKYFSVILGAWAVGTMLGPAVGGAFVQTVNWRWCFYLNLPFCGVALPLAFYGIHLHTERRRVREKLAMIDWIGGILLTSSLTLFLLGISLGGVQCDWDSWRTLLPLGAGISGVAVTIEFERRYASHPVLSRSLFNSASANVSYATAFFQGLILCMALYYVTFYFSAVHLRPSLMAGVDLFPATFLLLPSSLVTSVLITRCGSYRGAVWAGWAIACAGCGILVSWDAQTGPEVWATALCVLGTGLGMVLTSVNFAVQASCTRTIDSGNAGAMYAFMRTTGMTVGVAVGGTIFQNLMKLQLGRHGVDVNIAANAEAFVEDTLRHLPQDDRLFILIREAYVFGFRGVFIAMTILSATALIVSTAIKHRSMDRLLHGRFSLARSEGPISG